jgi:hypothetical protein
MSYYDFDDHFWTPQTVVSTKKSLYENLIHFVPITFLAICIGLLITILFKINKSDTDGNFLNANNLGSNCLMLKSNSEFKVYCSKPD